MQLTEHRPTLAGFARLARIARLSVRFVLVSAFASASFAVSSPASADDEAAGAVSHAKPSTSAPKLEDGSTKRATFEMATYADSDHITVYSPSVAASVENVTQGMSLRGSYLVDVVSAASVDIISTASPGWHEVRHAGTIETEYKPHEFGVTIGGSVSSEPDYLSYGLGFAVAQDFDEKNTTLTAGYGYGHDTASRGPTPFAVFSRIIEHSTLNLGLTQVVNKSTVASVSGDMILDSGDQSKPYRYIPMFSPDVAAQVPRGASIQAVNANRLPEAPLEQLPLNRQRYAVTGRLGHRFDASTIRLEERVYVDSWLLVASTTDARWIFDAGRRFAIWPHAHFHMQSGVDFWKRAYVSNNVNGSWDLPEFRTGDRELGPLRTIEGGGGIRAFLGSNADPQAWSLTLQGDAMYTDFLDDIFTTSRTGFLGTLSFEGEL
jgi:hypothetical protein